MTSRLTSILENTNKNLKIGTLGDFNINMLEDTKKKNEWLSFLSSYDFEQTIFEPTRITPTTATSIDGIYTNFKNEYCV